MSRIGDLVAEHCPNGAPSKALGQIGELVRGNGMPKSDFAENGVGAIHYGQIYTYYGTWARDTLSFVAPATASRLAKVDPGDIIITNTSENYDDVCKGVAWLGSDQIVTGGHATVFKHDQDPRFVAYWLQSPSFRRQKRRLATGTKVIDVSAKQLATVEMPIPPLKIQREIAETLNKTETLKAELELGVTAERDLRSRQYAHFAHILLESGEDVERVRLGDVATIVRGASPRPIKSFMCSADEGVPWIKIGDVPADGKYITRTAQHVTPAGAAKSRRVRPGDFVLSNSMSFGRPYISEIDGYIHDGWLAISHFEESFVSDYLYYLLRSSPVQQELARRAGAGTVKNLNADIVRSVHVPLPRPERQAEVVALLDRYGQLVEDLDIGLSAELQARGQQYEHFRDSLLNFPEVVA